METEIQSEVVSKSRKKMLQNMKLKGFSKDGQEASKKTPAPKALPSASQEGRRKWLIGQD